MDAHKLGIDALLDIVSTLNDRLAEYQVRLGLVEHAVATFAFSNDPKALATLTSSLELVKLDWIEQGSPNTKQHLISVLKMGPSKTGPAGRRIAK